jgi:hypothetical protein
MQNCISLNSYNFILVDNGPLELKHAGGTSQSEIITQLSAFVDLTTMFVK